MSGVVRPQYAPYTRDVDGGSSIEVSESNIFSARPPFSAVTHWHGIGHRHSVSFRDAGYNLLVHVPPIGQGMADIRSRDRRDRLGSFNLHDELDLYACGTYGHIRAGRPDLYDSTAMPARTREISSPALANRV
jgi:hypothetical protein